MKFISSFTILLSCFIYANAQTEKLLPVDERGKLIYYEVVDLKNTPMDSLKTRAIKYLKKENAALKFKLAQGDTTFIATGKMIINKTLLVMSHPSGEILYHFQAEVKEGKYRFWLTDFSFIPYQRDRYGNFVANSTIGTPLESNPGKLNIAQWKEYQVQTAKYAKDLAIKFKNYMANKIPVAATVPEKKIVTKKW